MHPSPRRPLPLALVAVALAAGLRAAEPQVPDWALPGSATHQQVPPPRGFHRPTVTLAVPIGIFEGQSDVGGALVPGAALFDAPRRAYTIRSAGYNIWYTRDEFRYLWRRVSGDLTLAADVTFPNPDGYGDRKAVLIVRQDLDDDSREVMVALHGAGLIHLALRPEKGANIVETQRLNAPAVAPGARPIRLGLRRRSDLFTLLVSLKGEPMHPVGAPVSMPFPSPAYAGIAFCSHLPATADAARLSDVLFEEPAR